MTDETKGRRRGRAATITVTKDTRELLDGLRGTTSVDQTIRRLASSTTAKRSRESFALDFRLAMTPDEELPNLTLLAEAVTPVTDAEGAVMGLLVQGPYGGETKKAVTELLSWLRSLRKQDHVRLAVLRGGHAMTARVKDAVVYGPSLHMGGVGYSLIVLADPADVVDPAGLGMTMTEAEWRRRWIR